MARVTNYIDNLNDRKVGSSDSGNQRIDGFREYSHLTQAHSEASVFKEFADKGYSALRHLGR